MTGRMYRLEVEGELSDPTGSVFEGLKLDYEDGNTVLTGPIRDQSELQGVLRRVSDLGLTLVNLNVLTARSACSSSRPASPGHEQS
ncbi:MAG: hypothetical protein ACLPV4_07890 [Solirubrobacteraceae bacterium]